MSRVEAGGVTLELLPQKAAWWAAERTLLIADAHIGKAVSFRRLGVPVPPGTTSETLDRLAREWQVSKSEALRRAIRSAASVDLPDRVTLFRSLQEAAGVTREKADRWVASVRAERAGIPRPRSARRR